MIHHAFTDVTTVPFEGPQLQEPAGLPALRRRRAGRGQDDARTPAFLGDYWHTFRGTGADPFGPGTALRPWDDGSRVARERADPRPGGLRVHRQARLPLLRLPRPRRGSRGQEPRRDQPQPRRRRGSAQGGAATHGHQVALGHGEPVHQSALRARRGHQPERGGVCLCRRAGQEGH